LLSKHRPLGQRSRLAERIARQNVRIINVGKRGERSNREPESSRGVAGYQVELAAERAPTFGHPAAAQVGRLPHLYWKDVARRLVEAMLEDANDARTLGRILQLVLFRRDIERELLFDEREIAGIFIGGNAAVGRQTELRAQRAHQLLGVHDGGFRRLGLAVDEVRIAPQWLLVAAPIKRERPPRQLLAGVPLALAEVQQAAGGEALLQAADQILRVGTL